MERAAYDYKAALSDLSGVDIKNHDNDPTKMVRAIRNWFVETVDLKGVASPTAIWYEFNNFTFGFYAQREDEGFSDEDLHMMPVPEYIDFIRNWILANSG